MKHLDQFEAELRARAAHCYPEQREVIRCIPYTTILDDERRYGDMISDLPFELSPFVKESPEQIAARLVPGLEFSGGEVRSTRGYINLYLNSLPAEALYEEFSQWLERRDERISLRSCVVSVVLADEAIVKGNLRLCCRALFHAKLLRGCGVAVDVVINGGRQAGEAGDEPFLSEFVERLRERTVFDSHSTADSPSSEHADAVFSWLPPSQAPHRLDRAYVSRRAIDRRLLVRQAPALRWWGGRWSPEEIERLARYSADQVPAAVNYLASSLLAEELDLAVPMLQESAQLGWAARVAHARLERLLADTAASERDDAAAVALVEQSLFALRLLLLEFESSLFRGQAERYYDRLHGFYRQLHATFNAPGFRAILERDGRGPVTSKGLQILQSYVDFLSRAWRRERSVEQ